MQNSDPHFALTGFTLVELLVAATMFSVLLVGVGSHVQGGLTVWRRATSVEQTLQHQRLGFERLERDLANSIIYDPREDSYGLEAGLLPEPDLTAASLAWFTISTTTRQPPAVRYVTYRCETLQGQTGLWRGSQSIGAARAREPATMQLLLPGCGELAVRYGYLGETTKTLEWHEDWPTAVTELPRLVEVTLTLGPRRVTQVFAIPSGILKTFQPPT